MEFVHCDVTKYEDIYGLFVKARELHRRIDHAVSCAGIFEQGNWFDPDLTLDTVKREGNSKVLDVNVKGTMDFARIAAVFLRDSGEGAKRKGKGQDAEDKSLVLLSSVNAFRESPGLFLYQMSKHAIQGLLRSSRKPLWELDGVRVNAVNPGVTDTPMAHHIAVKFQAAGLYSQSAESVAKIIMGLILDEKMVGKSIYIEGGDGWEFEDSFIEQQAAWLGEEPTRRMRVNTEAVQRGALLEK
ncbi:hypothetical protein LTR86_008738 [Recurvomyces mirabilis]|nr:hypothetical protein LTR86_008738 [Recurvomyces mirabilis]